MADVSEESVLGALESAFGNAPTPKPAEAPKMPIKAIAEPPEEAPGEAELPELDASEYDAGEAEDTADEDVGAPIPDEPEFEVEVNGRAEVVRGKEQIKELLQKGLDYSRRSENNARQADILAAQQRALELQQQVHNALYDDATQLRAIEKQLEGFNNVDWSAAFDSDPFNAMKVKAQRDELRELRNNKINELNQKHAAIQQGQAQAAQATLRAEEQALLAKLPQWRNSEQAAKEKSALVKYLADAGFQQGEIASIQDHRALLVTRKAWLYDQLQAGKAEKMKQVRDAPALAKPGASSAQSKPNAKQSFAKFQQELRAQGKKGNSRAQEDLMLGVLGRTFK